MLPAKSGDKDQQEQEEQPSVMDLTQEMPTHTEYREKTQSTYHK